MSRSRFWLALATSLLLPLTGGSPCPSHEIKALEIVAEGRTDAKGLWRFPAPAPELYRVTVDAGAGHQTTIRLRIPPRAEVPGTPASVAENVHEGPSRAEFTRFPWGEMALGLTAIALLFLIWRTLRGWRRRGCGTPRPAQASLPMPGSLPRAERKSP